MNKFSINLTFYLPILNFLLIIIGKVTKDYFTIKIYCYLCIIPLKRSIDMGNYINIGNSSFKEAREGGFIDKSSLIAEVNSTLGTKNKRICVTRSRRFGKSTAADMLCAYYDKSCDSRDLFRGLSIEADPTFEKHLNKYSVIFVSLATFTTKFDHDPEIVKKMEQTLMHDIHGDFPDVEMRPQDDLMDLLSRIAQSKGEKFFMIIDEWDAIMREFRNSDTVMVHYVKFLRRLFKDPITSRVFVGAYLTGILPIMKDWTQSALNNFDEYTMIEADQFARHFGFTSEEVKALCLKHGMDINEMKKWYDGYQIGDEPSMYNPNSVISAIKRNKCRNYWCSTGAYEAITKYIKKNFEGLKDDIISMLAGGRCKVDYTKFSNDLEVIKSKDDVLTVLIHLGYLSYDSTDKKCYIPNLEVREEMRHAVEDVNWPVVTKAIEASDALLQSLLDGDAMAVAKGLEEVHENETSILSYNDENSLACVMKLAFYSAQDDYIIHRELATGKGFADLTFIPRPNVDKPGIIMELKCNKDTATALQQIKAKNYAAKVCQYTTDIIYVGINYDVDSKMHTCEIEKA